ncbi:MAG: CBS domain-containing protein [Halieaceae bacterium]
MPQPTKIKDCMRRNPLTIDPEANLLQAVETIVDNKLTGLTVSEADGTVVGILSELDCIKAVLTAIYNDGNPEHSLVKDAMSTDLVSCKAEDNIVEVARSMVDSRQRRRPVLENGKLVGQVSSSNVLWALMEHSRRKVVSGK